MKVDEAYHEGVIRHNLKTLYEVERAPCDTPAMAAGMTNHVWATTELLSYRVPASFLDMLHTMEHLFPSLDVAHQGS